MVAIKELAATNLRILALLSFASIFFVGCAPRQAPIYNWGNYEGLLYKSYSEGGDPGAQLERLSEDVERTLAEGKKVPPGVHAHLGYLYFGQGNLAAARKHFVAEKEQFPESKVFIDGMLKRLSRRR